MTLAEELFEFTELSDVRKDVINGVYDESPDEEDKAKMREDLKLDCSSEAEYQEMIKILGL